MRCPLLCQETKRALLGVLAGEAKTTTDSLYAAAESATLKLNSPCVIRFDSILPCVEDQIDAIVNQTLKVRSASFAIHLVLIYQTYTFSAKFTMSLSFADVYCFLGAGDQSAAGHSAVRVRLESQWKDRKSVV